MTNFTDENMGNSALRIHKSHWSIIWYPILHMLHHETHQLMNQKHICQEKQGITISCSWDCAVDLQICGPLKMIVIIISIKIMAMSIIVTIIVLSLFFLSLTSLYAPSQFGTLIHNFLYGRLCNNSLTLVTFIIVKCIQSVPCGPSTSFTL